MVFACLTSCFRRQATPPPPPPPALPSSSGFGLVPDASDALTHGDTPCDPSDAPIPDSSGAVVRRPLSRGGTGDVGAMSAGYLGAAPAPATDYGSASAPDSTTPFTNPNRLGRKVVPKVVLLGVALALGGTAVVLPFLLPAKIFALTFLGFTFGPSLLIGGGAVCILSLPLFLTPIGMNIYEHRKLNALLEKLKAAEFYQDPARAAALGDAINLLAQHGKLNAYRLLFVVTKGCHSGEYSTYAAFAVDFARTFSWSLRRRPEPLLSDDALLTNFLRELGEETIPLSDEYLRREEAHEHLSSEERIEYYKYQLGLHLWACRRGLVEFSAPSTSPESF